MVKIGNKKISVDVCYNRGKHPHWKESITLNLNNESKCVVEVKSKMILPDSEIGSFEIDLQEIESIGKISKWFTIMHKDKPAGKILIEAHSIPDKKDASNQDLFEKKQKVDLMNQENNEPPHQNTSSHQPNDQMQTEEGFVNNQETFNFPKLEELPHPCGTGMEGTDIIKQDGNQVNKGHTSHESDIRTKCQMEEYPEKNPQNLEDIKIEPTPGQQTKLFNKSKPEIPKRESPQQRTQWFNEESPDMVKGEEWKLSQEDNSQKKS